MSLQPESVALDADAAIPFRDQPLELGAAGIVGVTLELDREEQEHEGPKKNRRHRDLVVTAHALGTAIVELERRAEAPPIDLALSLNEEGP